MNDSRKQRNLIIIIYLLKNKEGYNRGSIRIEANSTMHLGNSDGSTIYPFENLTVVQNEDHPKIKKIFNCLHYTSFINTYKFNLK